jgi:uncharacterized protein YndB with AHSA1/START domain
MDTLKFRVEINAPREKVWETLWGDKTYRLWTSAFSEGSYAESEWLEGSKIRFLGPDGDGMHSMIHKLVANEQMQFRHIGEIKNGEETQSSWEGAMESYYLSDKNGGTEVRVELDSVGENMDYFNDAFPKALQILKQTAEQ